LMLWLPPRLLAFLPMSMSGPPEVTALAAGFHGVDPSKLAVMVLCGGVCLTGFILGIGANLSDVECMPPAARRDALFVAGLCWVMYSWRFCGVCFNEELGEACDFGGVRRAEFWFVCPMGGRCGLCCELLSRITLRVGVWVMVWTSMFWPRTRPVLNRTPALD
jgi:hypothetical protein